MVEPMAAALAAGTRIEGCGMWELNRRDEPAR